MSQFSTYLLPIQTFQPCKWASKSCLVTAESRKKLVDFAENQRSTKSVVGVRFAYTSIFLSLHEAVSVALLKYILVVVCKLSTVHTYFTDLA